MIGGERSRDPLLPSDWPQLDVGPPRGAGRAAGGGPRADRLARRRGLQGLPGAVQYSTVQGAVAQNQFFSGTSCFFCLVDARIAQILVLDPLRYLPFMRPTFDGEIAV